MSYVVEQSGVRVTGEAYDWVRLETSVDSDLNVVWNTHDGLADLWAEVDDSFGTVNLRVVDDEGNVITR